MYRERGVGVQIKSTPGKILFGLVFVVIGIVVTIIMINTGKVPSGWETIEGTIETITVTQDWDGDSYTTNHTVIVEFYVEGTRYEGELNTYYSSMYQGGPVTIAYNPEAPGQFKYGDDSFKIVNLVPLVFSLAGAFIIVSTILEVAKKKKNKQSESVESHMEEKVNEVKSEEKKDEFSFNPKDFE